MCLYSAASVFQVSACLLTARCRVVFWEGDSRPCGGHDQSTGPESALGWRGCSQSLRCLGLCHVTSSNTEQGPETSHMEGVELPGMSTVDCPSLTGIELGW